MFLFVRSGFGVAGVVGSAGVELEVVFLLLGFHFQYYSILRETRCTILIIGLRIIYQAKAKSKYVQDYWGCLKLE